MIVLLLFWTALLNGYISLFVTLLYKYTFYRSFEQLFICYSVSMDTDLVKEKKEDIWLSPMTKAPYNHRNPKSNVTTPKTSITRRLRTDLGRSVGVTTVKPLICLNRLSSAQPSNFADYTVCKSVLLLYLDIKINY